MHSNLNALFVAASPYLNGRSVQLAQRAAFHRLPTIYALRESVEVGGLISYGADIADAFCQAGIYVGLLVARAVHVFVRLTVAPETALA
jgi:putative ABC transport system substrate-binding protein